MAIQVSYSSVVVDALDGVDHLDIVAIEVAAGTSAKLEPDLNGGGFVVIRRAEGSWYTLAPFDRDGSPEDRVYVVDGSLCTKLNS